MKDIRKKVFIVDDHPIVREGLAQLINRESDLYVCGEAEDVMTALSLIDSLKPDIAVIDISLGGVSGLQLVKDLAARQKHVLSLVLSMCDERLYAERALRAGAKGYVMKQEATKSVVTAIRRVLDGKVYLSDEIASQLMHLFVGKGADAAESPLSTLTDRELEVFELIGQGFKTREIGDKLHLSTKTIETYREHLKNKLNLSNATELVRLAIESVHGEMTP
jgi:DNA-binding NarL/FixJ family response regulator